MKPRIWRVAAALSFLLSGGLLLGGSCGGGSAPLPPSPGIRDYQGPAWQRLPFGRVNLAGGNYLVQRVDLSLDTRLGSHRFGASWSSADARWHWSFELRFDGTTFVDASGAVQDVSAVSPGSALPGTTWRRVDDHTLKTKGGLVYRFDPTGALSGVHWSSSAYPQLHFLRGTVAGEERLIEVQQCASAGSCSLLYELAYDAAGRLASLHDRAGRGTDYEYDSEGRLLRARDALATARQAAGQRYAYGSQGELVSITTADGEQIDLQFQNGRLRSLRQVGAGDPIWRFSYAGKDSQGRFSTTVTDPGGQTTVVRYDARGRLLERESPLGDLTTWTWSGLRIQSVVDAAGQVLAMQYEDDDPVAVLLPGGNALAITYRPQAENRAAPLATAIESVRDALGPRLQHSFDAAGHLVEERNGAGETQRFGWSSTGELVSVTAPSGLSFQLSGYGEHGHATELRDGQGDLLATLHYDAVGNLLADGRTVSLPGLVSRVYDEDRNLQELLLADSPPGAAASSTQILRIERRLDGRPLRILRPYGGDTEIVYDVLGRPVEQRELADGVWRTTHLRYDSLGRLVETLRPNGMQVGRSFDAAGHLSSVYRRRGGTLEGVAVFRYDSGRLLSVADSIAGGSESLEYDPAGRIERTHFPGGEILEQDRDLRGRVVEERYFADASALQGGSPLRDLHFRYDPADRTTEVLEGGQSLIQRSFVAGRLVQIAYGNGLTRQWIYSTLSGVIGSIETRDAAGAVIEDSLFDYAPVLSPPALVTQWTMSLPGAFSAFEQESLFPPQDRPETTRRVVSTATPAGFETCSFDVLSNRLAVRDANTGGILATQRYNPEHNRLNEVRDAAGATLHRYSWDEAGFATRRDGTPIRWTADGRIASLGSELQVEWDLQGRVVAVTERGVRRVARFGGRMWADATGRLRTLDLGGEVEEDLESGTHLYRHLDYRGNVAFRTDDARRVVEAVQYDAFGVRNSLGAPTRSFAGGRVVGDLLWLGPRLYDPAAAAFLAPDPIFQLVNGYSYALGNPVELWDPSGQFSATAGQVTGVAAGGAIAVAGGGSPPAVAFGAGLAAGAAFGGTDGDIAVGGVATGAATALEASAGASPVGSLFFAGYVGGALLARAVDGLFSTSAAGGGSLGGGGGSGGGGAAPGGSGAGTPPGAPGAGPSGVDLGALGGAIGGICTPAGLTHIFDGDRWLLILLPLQLLLGYAVWRRHARRGP